MKNKNGNVKPKTKHLVTRKAGWAAIEVRWLKIYLKISMVVVSIHLVLKVHLPERTEIFICTPTCAWYQARTLRGYGGCVRIPLLGHIISKSCSFRPDPKMVIFLKIRTPFQKIACEPGYCDWIFVLPGPREGGGVSGGYSDFLTFACFRCSAPALTAHPRKYQKNLAYPKNTRSFHRTQTYQDYNVTKNANNAEHTEMPLNC